jgi:hypothetical protein
MSADAEWLAQQIRTEMTAGKTLDAAIKAVAQVHGLQFTLPQVLAATERLSAAPLKYKRIR